MVLAVGACVLLRMVTALTVDVLQSPDDKKLSVKVSERLFKEISVLNHLYYHLNLFL